MKRIVVIALILMNPQNGIFVNDDYTPYHDSADVLLYDYSSSNELEIEITEGEGYGESEQNAEPVYTLSNEMREIVNRLYQEY